MQICKPKWLNKIIVITYTCVVAHSKSTATLWVCMCIKEKVN